MIRAGAWRHAVRFSSHFSAQQLDEVAQLGAQLCQLMVHESSTAMTNESASDDPPGLTDAMASRINTTGRLIEIQAEL